MTTRHIKNILFLLCAISFLTGCASTEAQQVMDPIQYNGSWNYQTNKSAYLYLQQGDDVVSKKHAALPMNASLPEFIVYEAFEGISHQQNSEIHTYRYDLRQQKVFMHSLEKTLKEKHAFKKIKWDKAQIKLKKDVKQDAVLMTIYFKQSNVTRDYQRLSITLDVVLKIEDISNGNIFKRTYVVYSKPEVNLFRHKTFKEHQKEVSEKLLNKIMQGLAQWYRQENKEIV